MILLDTQNTDTWHLTLEIITILAFFGTAVGLFFNFSNKVNVIEERLNNAKDTMVQDVETLKNSITEIKERADAAENKLEQKMQRLEDKIDILPNTIANTFKTLMQATNK